MVLLEYIRIDEQMKKKDKLHQLEVFKEYFGYAIKNIEFYLNYQMIKKEEQTDG